MDKQKFLNYALIVVLTILVMQVFTNKQEDTQAIKDDLSIQALNKVKVGNVVSLSLKNNTSETITLPNDCPKEYFDVSRYENGEWKQIKASANSFRCEEGDFTLQPNERIMVSYQSFQREIFNEMGKYRIEIPLGEKTFLHEFEIVNPGIFGKVWRLLIYQPIYNILVFFTRIANHSFGWGIVLLTLLLRLILFFPFQKSLKSQRRLQKIQPQLDEIKKRYEGNQQMIAMETVALMKKNNVSMFGSCLPILIQMPFLIALFWATRDGLGENTFVLLYPFQSGFDLSMVNESFLGLNLLQKGNQLYFALPIILALSQFIQMKLALHHTKKNQQNSPKKEGNPMQDAMQSMNKIMPYMMPLMIGFFSISLPAGVGIYWGTSTIFGIFQQLIVNREVK